MGRVVKVCGTSAMFAVYVERPAEAVMRAADT